MIPLEKQSQVREMGDISFIVSPLPFRQSRNGLTRLTRMIAPAIRALGETKSKVSALMGAMNDNDSKEEVFLSVISAAITSITDEDQDWFENAFAPLTRLRFPDPNDPTGYREPQLSHELKRDPDFFFGERMALYYKWLAFGIEITYKDFFSAALREIGAAMPKAKTPKQSPSALNSPTE